MIKNNFQISIITLGKDDYKKFIKTFKSIKSQRIDFPTEWLIIDGSKENNHKRNEKAIKKISQTQENIFINHLNSNLLKIEGIYQCMNYGKRISKGKFIIFLNSGDTFFNKNSLKIFLDNTLNIDIHSSLVFGQAKIIANENIYWYFPGKRLTNIKRWLKYFEPNHQTMLVSNTLANKFDFPTNFNIIGDEYWKRKILNTASDVIYINKPVTKFFLDGVSSTKPSKRTIIEMIKNKNITFLRKLIFFIKYIFPEKFFFLYFLMQKYKSYLFDLFI